MRRREFIGALGAIATVWPLPSLGQSTSTPAIGFLHPATVEPVKPLAAAFREGLKEMGYLEGQNVFIHYALAQGRYDQLPKLASELVRLEVAAIAAVGGDPSVLAAKGATSSIPIIFNTGSDPSKIGWVTRLNRPDGNITGINQLTGLAAQKQLELMHELLPRTVSIGLIQNPANPAARSRREELERAAKSLGRELQVVDAGNEADLPAAFEKLATLQVGGFLIVGDSILLSLREKIVGLAAEYQIPGIYSRREYTFAGGLLSYGANLNESYRLTGAYAGRILKGEKPADLPIQQSAKLDLVINIKTAQRLGFPIPDSILRRADEVIE